MLDLDLSVRVGPAELEARIAARGRRVAVVGPSGAGKSTLLRVVAGLERRARGRVAFEGRAWLDTSARTHVPPWERRVGWVPQDALLFPHLSVRRNLAYAGADAERVERVAAALQVDGLLERRPRFLSGGERQRVALGRALLSDPRLLLLDEPFAALDRPLRRELAGRLARLADERDLPIVLVSHDEADADLIATERWIVEGGVVRAG
ncbi:MAG: ATP-binding cassette domain-containing protein [Gemmatimonadetes bacterium]|nr:MAG: ATP-binding cassette domain-containing protein [Gemmatimonadota bacterium]